MSDAQYKKEEAALYKKLVAAGYTDILTTDELRQQFEVLGFMAPLVVVRRLSDGAKGSMEFTHMPRLYFNFILDNPPRRLLKKVVESSDAEGGFSLCSCGHTGEGPSSQHGDTGFTPGHGACRECNCLRFNWVAFREGFDPVEFARRRQAHGNPPRKWMGEKPTTCQNCGQRFGAFFYDSPVAGGHSWGLFCDQCRTPGMGQTYRMDTLEKVTPGADPKKTLAKHKSRGHFLMSEGQYNDLTSADMGICVSCGAQQEGCEPDARGYECETCGAKSVYGTAELLLMGRIHINPPERMQQCERCKQYGRDMHTEEGITLCDYCGSDGKLKNPAEPAKDRVGSCGYIGIYKGKQYEVYADTSYGAQKKLATQLGVKEKKRHEISVYLAEKNGEQVTTVLDNPQGEWRCEGCGAPARTPLDLSYDVCMECTEARHRGAVHSRCSCGRLRRPKTVTHLGRTWQTCLRCLAPIPATQKNPPAARYTFNGRL